MSNKSPESRITRYIALIVALASLYQMYQATMIVGTLQTTLGQFSEAAPTYTSECREKSLDAHYAMTLQLRSNADGGGQDSPGHFDFCEPALNAEDCQSMARAHAVKLSKIHAVNGFEWQCAVHKPDDYSPANYGRSFRQDGGAMRETTRSGEPLLPALPENKS